MSGEQWGPSGNVSERRDVALLHTSPVHEPTFTALFTELAPHLTLKHATQPQLLDLAVEQANHPNVVALKVQDAVTRLARGASVVLCTCSTIGAYAESTPGARVVRVDRAMARHAVERASRIHVVAALPETLPATMSLLHDEGARAGKDVQITSSVVLRAWAAFLEGHSDAYLDTIARHVDQVNDQVEVVVLAQASMAGAAARASSPVPILSSPRLAVQSVLQLFSR
ncbi:aspartate/glutamate racemase family protein [Deinococcus aquatilis]|uniref:aspartate/glutamate racemase family protein n=1 Tax=Deinococcus aquatilis TaxID=519440 RepID=UPI000368A2AB|nr:aspartate/glutamate racemase family protein [Deinococcus aquatilis]